MTPAMVLPINISPRAPSSLVNTEGRERPNTDPYGISLTFSLHTDMNPSTNTGCSSLTRKDSSWLGEFLVHTSLFYCLNYH